MLACTKPQQLNKGEGERRRSEGDKINLIDLGFERGKVVGFRRRRRK